MAQTLSRSPLLGNGNAVKPTEDAVKKVGNSVDAVEKELKALSAGSCSECIPEEPGSAGLFQRVAALLRSHFPIVGSAIVFVPLHLPIAIRPRIVAELRGIFQHLF